MLVEENKSVVRRWVDEVVNGRNLDVADEILSADFGSPRGNRQEFKQLTAYIHTAFPDFHRAIDELIGEGDKVVVRWTNRGTHTGGEYLGLPATGKQLEGPGVSIFRIVDGKIVEQWGVFDRLALRQQLGFTLVPPQEQGEQ